LLFKASNEELNIHATNFCIQIGQKARNPTRGNFLNFGRVRFKSELDGNRNF
jgi:hypothetical protein